MARWKLHARYPIHIVTGDKATFVGVGKVFNNRSHARDNFDKLPIHTFHNLRRFAAIACRAHRLDRTLVTGHVDELGTGNFRSKR